MSWCRDTGTYLTACAGHYAVLSGKDSKAALGLFSGLFFGIFQLTHHCAKRVVQSPDRIVIPRQLFSNEW